MEGREVITAESCPPELGLARSFLAAHERSEAQRRARERRQFLDFGGRIILVIVAIWVLFWLVACLVATVALVAARRFLYRRLTLRSARLAERVALAERTTEGLLIAIATTRALFCRAERAPPDYEIVLGRRRLAPALAAAVELHHGQTLAALRRGAATGRRHVLLLRDFDHEYAYDDNGTVWQFTREGDTRKRFYRELAEIVGADRGVVTLANAYDRDPFGRLDTGVGHLFVEPDDWKRALRVLAQTADLILVYLGRGGEGLKFELQLLHDLSRETDAIVVLREERAEGSRGDVTMRQLDAQRFVTCFEEELEEVLNDRLLALDARIRRMDAPS
jgi:hypothetical protein